MKSVKWMYVSAMAIAFGMLSFATVACHDDDDDPKPAEGEVIETPKPVVEYYIKGAVTVKGEGKSGVKVKVGDKDCITDSKGEFSVTESNTGTYEVSVAPNGYLSQKTSVKIADNAENRSVVNQPTGLQFSEPVNISIPNPIPGVTFPKATMQLSYLNPDNGEWEVQAAEVTVGEANYKAPVTHFSAYAIENQVNSKVEKEVIQKDEILGQESRDNSENAKALTGIVLKYKEKTGWDYEKGRGVVEAIKEALGSSVPENTLNAMAAYLKTRMYSLMGTTSGVTETERTYNTVNVNGYTEMNYTCYAKTRKTTLSTTVVYGGSEKTISVSAIRYTGADQQYKTVTYNPTHSGGKGGSI